MDHTAPTAADHAAPTTAPTTAGTRSRRRRSRPYADADGARRRWGGLGDEQVRAAASADPVGYVADRLPMRSRRDGTVAVAMRRDQDDSGRRRGGLVLLVDGMPDDPGTEDCAAALAPFVAAAVPGGVTGIGLVRHRRGDAVALDSDRRWRRSLRAAAVQAGIDDLGMAVRTRDGSLLRID